MYQQLMIEKHLLIWKKNKKGVWKKWNEIGEKENDVFTYYNLTKKEGLLFKSETIPHKQSRFGKRNSAWGKMAMKNDIYLCVLFKTKHC